MIKADCDFGSVPTLFEHLLLAVGHCVFLCRFSPALLSARVFFPHGYRNVGLYAEQAFDVFEHVALEPRLSGDLLNLSARVLKEFQGLLCFFLGWHLEWHLVIEALGRILRRRLSFIALEERCLLARFLHRDTDAEPANARTSRRFDCETDLGAQLDQWADFAIWSCLPLAAWWLWPEILRREAVFVVLAVACLLLPTAIAYLKYREVPGYHTCSAKTSAVLMGVSVPLLQIFDFPWPFRVAALWQLVAAIDELGITLLLAECQHDVASVFHAARDRRTGPAD